MRANKMRKYEIGTHRPTENKVMRATLEEQTNIWLQKIKDAEAQNRTGIAIQDVALVLKALIREIQAGKVDREVISEIARRKPVLASLQKIR